jgi:hypothetical protein
MERLLFNLDSEALLTRSEISLPMSMKEDLKTSADEAYDDKKYADGMEAVESFIVIKADKEVDRCRFPFSIFVRV